MIGQSEQHKREATQDEAAGWLLRVQSADALEADWLALQAWLEASPENRAAYDRVERVAAELADAASELSRALAAPAPAPRRTRPALRGRQFAPRIWRAAGGLAAAAAALIVFVAVRPEAPAQPEVYQTAKGERRTLDLADGSHIDLNSGSRLTVRLARDGRYVDLAEGQASFDVAKDTARPFLIAVGDRNIRVIGTEFDVLRHEGRLKVTVREGVVAVQPARAHSRIEPVTLRAGDQFEHLRGARVATVQQVDPEAAFAWRAGSLVYRGETLASVVGDLNRYFDTPIRVAGPAADLHFSGVLRIESQDAMIRRLQAFLPVSAERGPEGVTLRARPARS